MSTPVPLTKPCTQTTGQSDFRVWGFVLSGVRRLADPVVRF